MKELNDLRKGIGAAKGYAIGTAFVLAPEPPEEFGKTAADAGPEERRLKRAVELSREQLRELSASVREKSGEKDAQIIESHLNYLDDIAFTGEACRRIREEHLTAEKAVSDVARELSRTFSEFDDEYIKERADDIRDVGARMIRNLSGRDHSPDFSRMEPGTVLFAHGLTPSETARLDRRKISGFVMESGGKTSHAAILANGIGIAAVVGCRGILERVRTGDPVIVDGSAGDVILRPDESTLRKYRALAGRFAESRADSAEAANREILLPDGKRILVTANIGGLDDLKAALENGADGVGLFRTEFLFMGRSSIPSEEEQFSVYRKAAEALGEKPLKIRTLDVGGDKNLPYLKLPQEANPFLGLRAIRLCLKYPEVFRTQLRAILRAAAYGTVQIMFPMIGSLKELEAAGELLEDCRSGLAREGIAYGSAQVGMMVEIPSAALLADEFARRVDFFSIGTNDLTQYTLAADRMNEEVAGIYDPMSPAVLRLIRITIRAAHAASIPCCMCGELASDETAVPLLLEEGLDQFSVSPGLIAETKKNLLKRIRS